MDVCFYGLLFGPLVRPSNRSNVNFYVLLWTCASMDLYMSLCFEPQTVRTFTSMYVYGRVLQWPSIWPCDSTHKPFARVLLCSSMYVCSSVPLSRGVVLGLLRTLVYFFLFLSTSGPPPLYTPLPLPSNSALSYSSVPLSSHM